MNKTRLFITALLLVAFCFAQLLVAQTPTATVKRGFKVEYSNLLPNARYGEVPIRVRVSRLPVVPSTNDESFHVGVSNGWNYDYSGSSTTSTELVLPAGKTSAEVELLVERQDDYCSLVVEQGKVHTTSRGDDLLNQQIQIYGNNNNNLTRGEGTWLLISSNAPKNQTTSQTCYPGRRNNNSLATTTGNNIFNKSFRNGKKIPGLKKLFGEPLDDMLNRENWHALQPAELPQTWVGLSAISNILISNDEFQSLTQVPAYRKIIEQWVAAGGDLIVFNKKNSLAHADSVFPALLGAERAKPPRRWAAVGSNKTGASIQYSKNHAFEAASELVAKNRAALSPYLNGMVVVMVAPEKLPTWFADRHFRNSIPITNQSTVVQDFGQESPIPGVGKPPILLFGIVTGMFLFLIGPVILVVVTLNNNRRFLFFFVPVFSFITCTTILGYAIIADFNKQLARTDTITVLDAQSGLAYSQASSAYYCGSQPPYYAYDTDTLIQTTTEYNGGYRIRQMPEENQLSSPRIQPRKNHEVFTAKPYRTQQRFLVAASAKNPEVPEVTNLLGGRIDRAFFEYRGKLYIVRDLEPKQTTLGIEQTYSSCRKELRQAVVDPQMRGGSRAFRTATKKISSIINQKEPHNFVAVIKVNPAVDPLIEPFEYKLQRHVVHGKY